MLWLRLANWLAERCLFEAYSLISENLACAIKGDCEDARRVISLAQSPVSLLSSVPLVATKGKYKLVSLV